MSRPLFGIFLGLLLAFPALSPSASPPAFDPEPYLGLRWYGVYLGREKVGYGSFRLTPAEDRGRAAWRTEFEVVYRLNLGGSRQEMSIREEKTYLPEEGLIAFSTLQKSLLGRIAFSGRREGDRFRVETPTGERSAPAAAESLADALAHLELVRRRPAPGDAVSTVQFETTFLLPVEVTHTVETVEESFGGGVPRMIYRLRSDFPGLGISTSSQIDGDLRTLEAGLGMVTIREEAEATARDLDRLGDLILATAVRTNRPLPRPRRIRALSLRLGGLSDPELALISPEQTWEKIGEESYYLSVATRPSAPGLGPRLPLAGPGFAAELAADAYIQSDHPAIREQAAEIAGEEKDARVVAQRLTGWVYSRLKKSYLAAIPNAVDVLEKGTGDCKAHSVLLVALARSLGLPGRTVSGLVAMEDGLFYYHQWVELFTGEWTPADPVFGQFPADAARIALSRSGPAEQLRLLNLIGRLSIDILDYSHHPEQPSLFISDDPFDGIQYPKETLPVLDP